MTMTDAERAVIEAAEAVQKAVLATVLHYSGREAVENMVAFTNPDDIELDGGDHG